MKIGSKWLLSHGSLKFGLFCIVQKWKNKNWSKVVVLIRFNEILLVLHRAKVEK
jgi:uncharacterized membrane protein